MLLISIAANFRALLTAAELRTAAGVAAGDTSRDTELAAIGLTVADTISEWCNIGSDGITPVTLRQETLVETFYPEYRGSSLTLARRFLGTVAVVEADVTLVSGTDYTIEGNMLVRRSDGHKRNWACTTIVVTYEAGFADVPTPLASVAAEMVGRLTGVARDPLTRSERIETVGVETIDRSFWVDAEAAAEITPDMVDKLSRYRMGLAW